MAPLGQGPKQTTRDLMVRPTALGTNEQLAQSSLCTAYVQQRDSADNLVVGKRYPKIPRAALIDPRNVTQVRLILQDNRNAKFRFLNR